MTEGDPIILFWTAPDEALFPSPVIARVRAVSVALLERERWQNSGPPYVKIGARVLYRKAAVLDWIRQHEVSHARETPALA